MDKIHLTLAYVCNLTLTTDWWRRHPSWTGIDTVASYGHVLFVSAVVCSPAIVKTVANMGLWAITVEAV